MARPAAAIPTSIAECMGKLQLFLGVWSGWTCIPNSHLALQDFVSTTLRMTSTEAHLCGTKPWVWLDKTMQSMDPDDKSPVCVYKPGIRKETIRPTRLPCWVTIWTAPRCQAYFSILIVTIVVQTSTELQDLDKATQSVGVVDVFKPRLKVNTPVHVDCGTCSTNCDRIFQCLSCQHTIFVDEGSCTSGRISISQWLPPKWPCKHPPHGHEDLPCSLALRIHSNVGEPEVCDWRFSERLWQLLWRAGGTPAPTLIGQQLEAVWAQSLATAVGPAKISSQNLILKLLGMLAIPQFKARFQARKQF